MGERRKIYPENLKLNALELVWTSGGSAAAAARALGIDSGLLNRGRRYGSPRVHQELAAMGINGAIAQRTVGFSSNCIAVVEKLRVCQQPVRDPVLLVGLP